MRRRQPSKSRLRALHPSTPATSILGGIERSDDECAAAAMPQQWQSAISMNATVMAAAPAAALLWFLFMTTVQITICAGRPAEAKPNNRDLFDDGALGHAPH